LNLRPSGYGVGGIAGGTLEIAAIVEDRVERINAFWDSLGEREALVVAVRVERER
jgi:hypothetical protein